MTEIEEKKVKDVTETQPKSVENPGKETSPGRRGPNRPFVRQGGSRSFDRRNDRNKRGGRFNKKGGRRNDRRSQEPEYFNEVLSVRMVTRVVKGGKRMRFSALVVIGDKKGKVGYGIKKGTDFQSAVQKATSQAKKNLIQINITENGSLDHAISTKYKAAKIFLKPATQGTGLIAGSFVRTVLQLAGVENIYSKVLGSNNKITGVQATFKALEKFKK